MKRFALFLAFTALADPSAKAGDPPKPSLGIKYRIDSLLKKGKDVDYVFAVPDWSLSELKQAGAMFTYLNATGIEVPSNSSPQDLSFAADGGLRESFGKAMRQLGVQLRGDLIAGSSSLPMAEQAKLLRQAQQPSDMSDFNDRVTQMNRVVEARLRGEMEGSRAQAEQRLFDQEKATLGDEKAKVNADTRKAQRIADMKAAKADLQAKGAGIAKRNPPSIAEMMALMDEFCLQQGIELVGHSFQKSNPVAAAPAPVDPETVPGYSVIVILTEKKIQTILGVTRTSLTSEMLVLKDGKLVAAARHNAQGALGIGRTAGEASGTAFAAVIQNGPKA